jgi:uncharacterized membrane protein YgcG
MTLLLTTTAFALGPPYPAPVPDRAVYDEADLVSPSTEAALEQRIDEIEARSGAEIVVYTEPNTDITEDENLSNAAALMDQWGVGRSGFDDGLVILVAKDPDPGQTRISTYGGAGFLSAYADPDALREIREGELVPWARAGDWDSALLATLAALDSRIGEGGRAALESARQLNAVIGLVGAPVILVVTAGFAWLRWRREGDDPELVDSESILMAGPPAEMTPPLATVVRAGQATQHTLNTTLIELAGSGRISFENLDRVASARSDAEPDPLLDPAVIVNRDAESDGLAVPQAMAWSTIRRMAGSGGRLTGRSLWRLNGELGAVRRRLEEEAVRLGWLARMPGPAMTGMMALGAVEVAAGVAAVIFGVALPMSGALLFGGALGIGGLVTVVLGRAMSQRTQSGAYVDAMLTAYRRTLRKTLEQARNMGEVVADPTVRVLADTPDKAVVWGIALGLHDEVSEVIARGLAEPGVAGRTGSAYYPAWLGSSDGTWRATGGDGGSGVVAGSGGIFSSAAIPDVGGMFNALGSIGSTPPSSSSDSSGGGFSGGGSSGGGGGSSSV